MHYILSNFQYLMPDIHLFTLNFVVDQKMLLSTLHVFWHFFQAFRTLNAFTCTKIHEVTTTEAATMSPVLHIGRSPRAHGACLTTHLGAVPGSYMELGHPCVVIVIFGIVIGGTTCQTDISIKWLHGN